MQLLKPSKSDLEENGLDKYLESAEALLEKYSATDLAALLLKTVAERSSRCGSCKNYA